MAATDRVHSLRFSFGVRPTPTSLLLLQLQEDLGAAHGASLGRFFGMRYSHFL